jgi:LAO/AO transport system kinase
LVTLSELAAQVLGGDRRALARAITLVESTRPDHQAEADALLGELMPHTGGAVRVGISGSPGAGKSTLIEALGVQLVDTGTKVAVLAVDPSSTRTGGSILGDKTRMEDLVRRPEAFVRPSPTGGTLGGVARRTREAMLCCEAAGFEVVIVETVGVGQSEVAVDGMVDTFVLLVPPASGDELQGIKRGIMELADVVVVTKADGALEVAANATAADYANALHLLRPKSEALALAGWTVPVVTCSSTLPRGIDHVWTAIQQHRAALVASGELGRRRAAQARDWMWAELGTALLERLRADPAAAAEAERLEAEVEAGRVPAPLAAARVLDAFGA